MYGVFVGIEGGREVDAMTSLFGQLALDLDAASVSPGDDAARYELRNDRCAPAATFVNEFVRGAFYRGYTPDTSEREARALFRRRFGYDPAIVARGMGGILLAGPIPGPGGATGSMGEIEYGGSLRGDSRTAKFVDKPCDVW
jgi:hypothetical protein